MIPNFKILNLFKYFSEFTKNIIDNLWQKNIYFHIIHLYKLDNPKETKLQTFPINHLFNNHYTQVYIYLLFNPMSKLDELIHLGKYSISIT